MEKRPAILHANCQGAPLAEALRASPEFDASFASRVYLNYARQPIPHAELDACGLFLYQHLGPEWGELASEALLRRLPSGCRSLCIPNMFFRGPWPLWSGAPGFDYRDVLLDHLLDMGLPRRDILHLHLRTPLAAKYDLAARLDETTALERARQAHTPVPYLDYVLDSFRSRSLFHTINHPRAELLAHAASGILCALGLQAPDPARLAALSTDYEEFSLPIHPQAAEFYGLAYADADTRYPVYGKTKTFEDYAAAYVDCRLAGIEDFISYLQVA
ncbi:MAG: WcbI family polysaccharide biosynthesis putative acetyltransferase [Humidesulfovibrio sp.]|nr:WcbI family polysaccharide biosynthesis putative acetyltransferase [Humidesulfovibrio sp.]